MRFNMREHRLEDIFNEASHQFSLRPEAKNLKITACFSQRLPLVKVDKERMLEVFFNILLKLAEYGDDCGDVVVGGWPEGGNIVILFKGAIKGKGKMGHTEVARYIDEDPRLGLCRSLVLAHGGDIWASAESGRDSMLYLTLPASKRAK